MYQTRLNNKEIQLPCCQILMYVTQRLQILHTGRYLCRHVNKAAIAVNTQRVIVRNVQKSSWIPHLKVLAVLTIGVAVSAT